MSGPLALLLSSLALVLLFRPCDGYPGNSREWASARFEFEPRSNRPETKSLLPFPISPASFLSEALKVVHGPSHALLGVSLWPNITGRLGDPGPLIGGIVVRIGVGLPGTGSVQVQVEVTDFLMFRHDGSLVLENDGTRKASPGTLLTLDGTKVVRAFARLMLPQNVAKLSAEFARSPRAFYEEQLRIFFPAELTLNFNVRGFMGLQGVVDRERRLTNDVTVSLTAGNIGQFPPKQFGYRLQEPFALINGKEVVVAKVNKLSTVFGHVIDERACQAIVGASLTRSMVEDLVATVVDLK